MSGWTLECDLGNTRCKWRLVGKSGIGSRGEVVCEQGFGALGELVSPDRICVACVASDTVRDAFLEGIAPLGVTPEFATSQACVAGVTNAYGADFGKLGVDRWLAVVAAYQRVGGAALVLDAGSALTADLVDSDGSHLGGYIVPGEQLMRRSLLSGTGKVRFGEQAVGDSLRFGRSTEEAVDTGVLAAQVGAALVALRQAERQIARGFAILVTGGAAHRLIRHLPVEVELVPELVLDGLKWVLPASE